MGEAHEFGFGGSPSWQRLGRAPAQAAPRVVGNAVACTVVARWEGQLEAPEPADVEPPHAP